MEREVGILELGTVPILGAEVACVDPCAEPGEHPLWGKAYWDPGFEATYYSFVDFAISQGYSVFFYDRLGTGQSSKYVPLLTQSPYPFHATKTQQSFGI